MFRVCLHCDQIKTVESFLREKPHKTANAYKYCKDCYHKVKIEIRKRYQARLDAIVKHNWNYQQEKPIQCTQCLTTRPTKYFTTLATDGTKFSDVCVDCDTRSCKKCKRELSLSQYQRNPRVKTSYHFTCKECSSWTHITNAMGKLTTGRVHKHSAYKNTSLQSEDVFVRQ